MRARAECQPLPSVCAPVVGGVTRITYVAAFRRRSLRATAWESASDVVCRCPLNAAAREHLISECAYRRTVCARLRVRVSVSAWDSLVEVAVGLPPRPRSLGLVTGLLSGAECAGHWSSVHSPPGLLISGRSAWPTAAPAAGRLGQLDLAFGSDASRDGSSGASASITAPSKSTIRHGACVERLPASPCHPRRRLVPHPPSDVRSARPSVGCCAEPALAPLATAGVSIGAGASAFSLHTHGPPPSLQTHPGGAPLRAARVTTRDCSCTCVRSPFRAPSPHLPARPVAVAAATAVAQHVGHGLAAAARQRQRARALSPQEAEQGPHQAAPLVPVREERSAHSVSLTTAPPR